MTVQLLATVETQIVAVMESARGSTGMSSAAASRSIAAGLFRRSASGAPLDDSSYPLEEFDRAYEIRWLGEADEDVEVRDEMSSHTLGLFKFVLRVGYLYGPALAALKTIWASTTENEATLAVRARRQALSDVRTKILRALTFQEIVQTTTDPSILSIDRDGDVSLNDLGAGRLLAEVPLKARLWYAQNSDYND